MVTGDIPLYPACWLWTSSVCGWWMCSCTPSSTGTLGLLCKSSHWASGFLHRPLGCCWTKILLLQRQVPPSYIEGSFASPGTWAVVSFTNLFQKSLLQTLFWSFLKPTSDVERGEVVIILVHFNLTCVLYPLATHSSFSMSECFLVQ